MIQLIPLHEAVFCENCERFSDSKGKCIGCESSALLNMAAVMQRKPVETEMEKLINMVDETATKYEGEEGA